MEDYRKIRVVKFVAPQAIGGSLQCVAICAAGEN